MPPAIVAAVQTLRKAITNPPKSGDALPAAIISRAAEPLEEMLASVADDARLPVLKLRRVAQEPFWASNAARDPVYRAELLALLRDLEREFTHKVSTNEKRDQYIHREIGKGTPLKTIMEHVNKRKSWEPILTVQGIHQAGKRYAKSVATFNV